MFLFCNCKNVEQLLLFNLLFYYQRKMRRLTKSSRLHLFSYNSVLIICLVKTAGKVTSAEERGHLVLVEICLTDIISILVIICVKGAGLAVRDPYFFLFCIFFTIMYSSRKAAAVRLPGTPSAAANIRNPGYRPAYSYKKSPLHSHAKGESPRYHLYSLSGSRRILQTASLRS